MAYTPYTVSRTPGAMPPPGAIPKHEANFTGMTPIQMSNGKTAYFMVPQPAPPTQPGALTPEAEAKREMHLNLLDALLEKMQEPAAKGGAPMNGMQPGAMGGMQQPGMMGGMQMQQPSMMTGMQQSKMSELPHSDVLMGNGFGASMMNGMAGINPMQPQMFWR